MSILKELLEAADNVIAVSGFDAISDILTEMRTLAKQKNKLNEGFTDNHNGELDRKFDDLENKLIAARRKLADINGYTDLSPEERNEAKSKVMANINVFRQSLYSVMLDLGMSEKEIKFHLDRIALDRKHGKPAERFTNVNKDEDKQKFSELVNQKRNFAKPEEMGQFVEPTKKPEKRKWYQKLFGM